MGRTERYEEFMILEALDHQTGYKTYHALQFVQRARHGKHDYAYMVRSHDEARRQERAMRLFE